MTCTCNKVRQSFHVTTIHKRHEICTKTHHNKCYSSNIITTVIKRTQTCELDPSLVSVSKNKKS